MATTDLATLQARSQPPAPISPALSRQVGFHASKLTPVGLGHEIAVADEPPPPVRQALETRAGMLGLWLKPAGAPALTDEMLKIMFMPSQASAEDTKALVKLYASDLADLPLFAVVKACADFRRGRAGDGHWRPTQGDIRKVALNYVVDLAREKRQIESVLTAKIRHVKIDPERRKEVADRMRRAIRGIPPDSKRPDNDLTDPTESEADFIARMQAPLVISDALRASLPHNQREAAE